MELSSLVAPTVVAGAVSSVISIVGVILSTRTTRGIHKERLEFERDIAERKFNFDKQLAEQKFQLEARLADRKRRQELAEEVLSGFYQARDIIRTIRTPMVMSGEAATRPKVESETEAVARQRDTYYVPLARLEENRREIGDLLARRYRAAASFGPVADDAFEKLHGAITGIANASQLLVRWSGDDTLKLDLDLRRNTERMIWWTGGAEPDLIATQVGAAVSSIERICRPVLQEPTI
jgi:hypothetical protein